MRKKTYSALLVVMTSFAIGGSFSYAAPEEAPERVSEPACKWEGILIS